MIDRRVFSDLDWGILGATLLLSLIGVAMIASASPESHKTWATLISWPVQINVPAYPWLKQSIWIGVGICALVGCLMLDYHRLTDRAPLFFFVMAVLLLAMLLGLAPLKGGARRWIMIRSIQIQPSELAKLVASLLVARVFGESRKEQLDTRDILGPGAAVGVLMLLIAAQPDLGTAFCIIPMFVTVIFLAGLRMKAFLGLFLAFVIVLGLGWKYAPLRDYQKQRIYSFMNPRFDPKGAGYQSIQSRIAVGSGGLLGRGYSQGSQSQLGYLPERHTDFIFSVLAEEFGFLGVFTVLFLYFVILWRSFEIGRLARDRPGAFLAAGIAAIIAFQVVYNVGMASGLVPVKGLPLPFMSYGGSSTLFAFMGIGLILNVRAHRFAN
ncbi:MAG: rod shape-determining protein RodA [Vicinamibacteria bacterium]|nr:rod shape-determining protein RodA [Vicinamibacteria bacterium]